jgi:hypothetical protein
LCRGFLLEFDDPFACRLAPIVDDDHSTFDDTEILLEGLFQQLIGHIAREILDFHSGTLTCEPNAERFAAQDVTVEVSFGLFSQLP